MIFLSILAASAVANCSNYDTTMDINQCLQREQAAAEVVLTASYKRALASAAQTDARTDWKRDNRPKTRDALVQAQRAWIVFRDAHCLSMSFTMRGGSGEGTAAGACKLALTEDRIGQLQEIAADY
jgi:uncharacterized protein YecT (DUF1311 family)